VYYGPTADITHDQIKKNLLESLGEAETNGIDVSRNGIVKPQSIRKVFSDSGSVLAKVETFDELNDWISFDYLGKTNRPIRDLKYVMHQAGILPGRLDRYSTYPFLVAISISVKKGIITILQRSGRANSDDLQELCTRVVGAIPDLPQGFTQLILSSDNLIELAKRYRAKKYRITKVRHLTKGGDLTYGNPEGLESDPDVAEAEEAYGTLNAIEGGKWKGLRIHVSDRGYELVLTKHRSWRKRLTVNPRAYKGYLPKNKLVSIVDHIIGYLIHVRPPVALKKNT
jgi:hypothetical protein